MLLLLAMAGCSEPPPAAAIGEPIAGLSATEMDRFRAGAALFDSVFTDATGLGPMFNENQCSACHTDPKSGGTGEQLLLRAATIDADGRCDALHDRGGDNVRTRATRVVTAAGIDREPVPAGATDTGRFQAPFLFGLGLAEAVPQDRLEAMADPQDENRDGISGRIGRDESGRPARFGHKAEFATIEDFVAGALAMEMGVTSPHVPVERTFVALPDDADPAADPEVDSITVARLGDFVRFLAPPPPIGSDDPAIRDEIRRGEREFERIGCTACHAPRLRTGRSDVSALDRKTVALYSDFLLHDLGPGLADVCGISADASELRTQPLAGLAYRARYLHDGRARSIDAAVRTHGGEATAARTMFENLPFDARQAILRFLANL